MMSAVCPICERQQDQGLVCSACCDVLEKELAEVRALMGELETTASKQARIGGGAGKGGPARERNPVNWNAVAVADDLTNTLTTWARDVNPECAGTWQLLVVHGTVKTPAAAAAMALLACIDAIRRHPAANELFDEITDAIRQARRAIDRPQDRVYLGQCMVPTPDEQGRDVTCLNEIYASPTAREVACKVCGVTHEVLERRRELLNRAKDMLFTVKEAAQMMGEVGHITVTESAIRGYIHRSSNPLSYRPNSKLIRLGDLLNVLVDESERKSA